MTTEFTGSYEPSDMENAILEEDIEIELEDDEEGLTSWRELITEQMMEEGEGWSDVLDYTISREELDEKFYDGYGITGGAPFVLWTHNNIYFSTAYDGKEWVSVLPRHPRSNYNLYFHIGDNDAFQSLPDDEEDEEEQQPIDTNWKEEGF
jgi:hypothetical protein